MSVSVFDFAAAGFGACIGSFLNVVVYRLPQEDPKQRTLLGRSQCPKCRKPIAWHDNVPVLGWLLLLGRSRCCRQRISIRYPLVELVTAILFVLLLRHSPHGVLVSGEGTQATFDTTRLWPVLWDAAFCSFLLASALIDWDHRILPDALNKPFAVMGCSIVAITSPGHAGTIGAVPNSPVLDSILTSLFGCGVGYAIVWLVRNGARPIFGREAMGLGDVKFLAAIGAFLGWQGALWTFFLGSFAGAIGGLLHRLVTKDSYVPFGPFLAIGAGLVMFFGTPIHEFVFHTWPEWQRSSPMALPVMGGAALVSLLALVLVVRRGRRNG